MIDLQSFRVNPKEVTSLLDEFEQFCLGKKFLSPDQFTHINEELSVSAVLSIGKNRMERREDGNHLIWLAPDKSEHDLGPLEKVNIMRDYPGFHRSRSLSLGQNFVENNDVVRVPATARHITVVKMKDGSVGYGPNYRAALRNAALRMHLKKKFNLASLSSLWKTIAGGNA